MGELTEMNIFKKTTSVNYSKNKENNGAVDLSLFTDTFNQHSFKTISSKPKTINSFVQSLRYLSLGFLNQKVSITIGGTNDLLKIQRKTTGDNRLIIKSPFDDGRVVGYLCPEFNGSLSIQNKDSVKISVIEKPWYRAIICSSNYKMSAKNPEKIEQTYASFENQRLQFNSCCPDDIDFKILLITAFLIIFSQ